jgi:hypothetical protein
MSPSILMPTKPTSGFGNQTLAKLTLAIAALAAVVSFDAMAVRVDGEPVRTNPSASAQAKSLQDSPFLTPLDGASPAVSFFIIDPARIEQAKQANASAFRKAMQIGITQTAKDEAFDGGRVNLNWQSNATGMAAQFRVRSSGALAARALLSLTQLPNGATLRFAGSDDPAKVVYAASVESLRTLTDGSGRYWTPITEGDTQIIEVSVADRATGALLPTIQIDAVSHIFATATDNFKAATQSKGLSGSCNVDAICPTQTAGYVNAKNAVAHLAFQAACGPGGALASCVCSGTLLNDTDLSTQIPYLYSANHCISTQTEASTLITYFNYDNPVCRGPDITPGQSRVVQGGAALLYADTNTDVLLLRLNGTPPSTAFFSGWDSDIITGSTPITVLHHPAGDPKKVTIGQTLSPPFTALSELGNTLYITPTYTSGTTEGGSSGSGIFTISSGNYFLRGGLFGGPASCASSGNTSNPSNRDYYSRFDLAYPKLQQWLGATPVAVRPLSQRGGIDIDGNNRSVLLVNSSAGVMSGGRLVNGAFQWTGLIGPGQTTRLLGAVDFASRGSSDLAFLNVTNLNSSGQGQASFWRNFNVASEQALRLVKPEWDVQAVGDLDGDGFGDLVWRFRGQTPNFDDTGVSYVWFTNGDTVAQVRKRGGAPLNWSLLGALDLNDDRAADMVYVSPTNAIRVLMATANRTCANLSAGNVAAGFTALRFADFTGSRKGDILTRNATTGAVQIISLNAAGITLPEFVGSPDNLDASCTSSTSIIPQTTISNFSSDPAWSLYAVGDFNGDGIFDIVWRRPDNQLVVWQMGTIGMQPTVIIAGPALNNFSPFPLQ